MKKFWKILGYILSGVLFVLLVGPLLIPVSGAPGTAQAEDLAAENGRFVEIDGIQVYVEETGSGEPALVLLHGFGASVFSWRGVMPQLSQAGAVTAYDRPAFGFTERPMPEEWPEGFNPYSAAYQPDLLVRLLDELGIEQAILVGHSAGGRVAVQTALAYPERVSALVLVAPALYGEGAPPLLRVASKLPQVDRLGPLLARSIQQNGVEVINRSWHDPSLITQATLEGYQAPLRLANWDRALWELTKVSYGADVEDRLGELDLPVLVVNGDDDQIVPSEQSIRAAQDIPGAQLAVLAESGHLPHEERPQAFLDVVLPFVSGLAAQP